MLQVIIMFKSIGVVIVLWYLSTLFTQTFSAMDTAFTATFNTLEVAAVASQKAFEK